MKKLLPFIFVTLVLFSGATPVALAQAPTPLKYTSLEPLPGISSTETAPQTFPGLINGAFKLLLGFGAMVAVVTLILGGIAYMTSEVLDKRDLARRRIQASVWGLLLLLSAWIILNTINPQILKFEFFNQDLAGISTQVAGNPAGAAGNSPAGTATQQSCTAAASGQGGYGGIVNTATACSRASLGGAYYIGTTNYTNCVSIAGGTCYYNTGI